LSAARAGAFFAGSFFAAARFTACFFIAARSSAGISGTGSTSIAAPRLRLRVTPAIVRHSWPRNIARSARRRRVSPASACSTPFTRALSQARN
jgi:hypothetical protein